MNNKVRKFLTSGKMQRQIIFPNGPVSNTYNSYNRNWFTDIIQDNNINVAIQGVKDYYKSPGFKARHSNIEDSPYDLKLVPEGNVIMHNLGVSENWYTSPNERDNTGIISVSRYPNEKGITSYDYDINEYSDTSAVLAAAHEAGHNMDAMRNSNLYNNSHYSDDYKELLDRKHPASLKINYDHNRALEALRHDVWTAPLYELSEDSFKQYGGYHSVLDAKGFDTGYVEKDEPGIHNITTGVIYSNDSERQFNKNSLKAQRLEAEKRAWNHDNNRYETLADIAADREGLKMENIWDAGIVDELGNPIKFTKEMLNKYKFTNSGKASRLISSFNDDDYIKLMNYGYKSGGKIKRFKSGGKNDLYSGLNTNIIKDPVKQAETESTFDWEAVKLNLKALGLNLEMHPDTLAYVEKVLRDLGLEGDPLNIALADALIESGGKPSTASKTSKQPTYWGLWQLSKLIIPIELRTGGILGVLDLANVFVNGLRNVNTWTNGAYPDPDDVDVAKLENRKPNMVLVGYANRKEPFNIFWGIIDPKYTNMYTLRNIPRNAKVKAFTDAKLRPLNRKDYAVRLAKAVKALEESVKRYLSNK